MHFLWMKPTILIQISLSIFIMGPNHNKLTLVEVKAWHQLSGKP